VEIKKMAPAVRDLAAEIKKMALVVRDLAVGIKKRDLAEVKLLNRQEVLNIIYILPIFYIRFPI
jgi:hypothetical protein